MRHVTKEALLAGAAIIRKGDDEDPASIVTKALDDLSKTVNERIDTDTKALNERLDMLETKINRPAITVDRKDGPLNLLNFMKAADGGYISGPGTETSDSIPARLSNGEFVVRASATRQHRSLLEAINDGVVSRFANGGYAHAPGGEKGAEMVIQVKK